MRDTALEAAETVIRRHGVDRTRIVDIAAVVGVNHALLYRHFKDRAALIDSVSERWLSRLRQDLDGIASGAGGPVERIRHWLIALHRMLSEKRRSDPELFRSYRRAHDEGRPFIGKHGTAIRWQLAKLVTEAMQSGALADAWRRPYRCSTRQRRSTIRPSSTSMPAPTGRRPSCRLSIC